MRLAVLFPSVIFQVAKEYNNPYILVEVNDIGDSIAATLNYDLEYPNVLMCAMRGRAGQVVGQGLLRKQNATRCKDERNCEEDWLR